MFNGLYRDREMEFSVLSHRRYLNESEIIELT
jgi:hypothetical protein